jgi:hypothetical protein
MPRPSAARPPDFGFDVVVRWGASVLVTKHLRSDLSAYEELFDGAAIERTEAGVDLVVGRERVAIVEGRTVRRWIGDVEVIVDATCAEPAFFPLAAPLKARHAASDAVSLAVHALLLLALVVWRAPLDEPDALVWERSDHLAIAEQPPGTEGLRDEAAESDSGVAVDPREAGAAGPGASTTAARGDPYQPQAGWRASARYQPELSLGDATDFGLAGLLASRSDTSLRSGDDPWTAEGIGDGRSWGAAWGSSEGVGGLSLSGIGEGGGGRGEGVALGGFGLSGVGSGGGCGGGCMGMLGLGSIGRGGMTGSHRTKPPVVRCFAEIGANCASHVSGRLPPEAVQRVVRQGFGRFRRCYDDVRREQPALSARVSTSFVIGRDGSVTSASSSGDGPSRLGACVADAFRALSFPRPEGGVVKVVYPIVFSPE